MNLRLLNLVTATEGDKVRGKEEQILDIANDTPKIDTRQLATKVAKFRLIVRSVASTTIVPIFTCAGTVTNKLL